jgi:hypothetical protein
VALSDETHNDRVLLRRILLLCQMPVDGGQTMEWGSVCAD